MPISSNILNLTPFFLIVSMDFAKRDLLVIFLVGRFSSKFHKDCAFCDTSIKFGTNVHWYMANIFRYWATRNSPFMSAILEFKMAAIWNLHFWFYLGLMLLLTRFWCLNVCFGGKESSNNNLHRIFCTNEPPYSISKWPLFETYIFDYLWV